MGPHGHGPDQAGHGGCCPHSHPSSHPGARANEHPRSIDGLVAEHYRRAGSHGRQWGLRGPARARVHESASDRACACPSTHRGAGPHAFGSTHHTRAPARAHPSTQRGAGPRAFCCNHRARAHARPSSAAWDAVVDHYLSPVPVAVLPCPARRSCDNMMLDLQVKNILCCLEDCNNSVLEDDNDSATSCLRRRRK